MPFLDYTPGRALLAFGRLIVLTGFWGFGGLLLIGLAVMGYRSLRGGAGRWLALVAVTVPLGYLFFWGSFSSSEWGGPWRFGPFYWLPVIIPGSIMAAAGFARLWRWDPVVARFVAAGMAALSLFVTVGLSASTSGWAPNGIGSTPRRWPPPPRSTGPWSSFPRWTALGCSSRSPWPATPPSTVRWCGRSIGAPPGTSRSSAASPAVPPTGSCRAPPDAPPPGSSVWRSSTGGSRRRVRDAVLRDAMQKARAGEAS